MSTFVTNSFAERVHRLALGLEPWDAIRRGRLLDPVRVDIEGRLPWTPRLIRDTDRPYRQTFVPGNTWPIADRHDSCLQAILYQPGLGDRIDLRIYDHQRRYVPRRLRAPLNTLEEVLAAERRGSSIPHARRVRRPALYPGAGYELNSRATGLRGYVLRDNEPMRWVRVEAYLHATGPDAPPSLLVGRAHGDDRGEFLLVLTPQAANTSELRDPFELRVVIWGPETIPAPHSPQQPLQDAYWDLPLELWPAPGLPDRVSPAEALPAGYVQGASRIVPFRLGRILSGADHVEPFDFVPA